MDTLTLRTPDDWHVHLRDGAALATTVAHSAAQFRRVLVMPNLRPPVTRVVDALDYRQRIMHHAPIDSDFDPLMGLYLSSIRPGRQPIPRPASPPCNASTRCWMPCNATTCRS